MVVLDLEGGINTMFRIREGYLDKVLVVTEPTIKSIETAERVVMTADRLGIEAIVVANRTHNLSDVAMVEDRFPGRQIVVVPHDDAVEEADRRGVAPIDHAPESAGVTAMRDLATAVTAARPA